MISPTFKTETDAIGCMEHIIHLAAHDGLNALGHGVSADIEVNPKSAELIAPMAISNLINPPHGKHMRYDSIIFCIAQLASYIKKSPRDKKSSLEL
ncbi:hypothetical protein O181_023965 [Austropuccinia psidii MF-1]|uniref:Uncharacterized protein n=1 Tax=Austropuccinia psidii MF-1 TaxID=1389203 RepID=A0A9Q3CJL8_9BASI|nr:hypothetical protein [Austropuccinia psidii MF-1]